MVVAGRGAVAQLDVRVAVRGVPRLLTGCRAGHDQVGAGGDVVLVGGDTVNHLLGTMLVLKLGLLPSQAGAHQLYAVILVVRMVQTLPHSLQALSNSLLLLLLLLPLKTDMEHGTAGLFVFPSKTFLHLTGAVTLVLLILLLLLVFVVLGVTDTISQHFKTIIKSIIIVGETLFGLQQTFLPGIFLFIALVDILETRGRAEQRIILIY